jgi:type VI protein secretion system component Hcp
MAEKSSDMLMRVMLNGLAVAAGSQTMISDEELKSDSLLTPVTAKDRFQNGRFFEIQDIDFKVGLKDPDAPEPKPEPKETDKDKGKDSKTTAPATRHVAFAGFRSSARTNYAVDLPPVTFHRLMDQASTVLFQCCSDSDSIDEINVVKRKATGYSEQYQSSRTGETFLRMDFKGVLITGVDWEEDHVIKEKYQFIYRECKISYRPQNPDGTLGSIINVSLPKPGK